jgi:hypothetical protein
MRLAISAIPGIKREFLPALSGLTSRRFRLGKVFRSSEEFFGQTAPLIGSQGRVLQSGGLMKKPHVLLIQHEKNLSGFNLARLCPILELINCETEICIYNKARKLMPAPGKTPPDLIILDRPFLPEVLPSPGQGLAGSGPLFCPQIVLSEEKALLETSQGKTEAQNFPFDVVALHGLVSACLINYPRKHLRMPAHLPCLFSVRGFNYFGEILSLGTGGAFIKTACQQIRTGDLLDVGIPLFGMKKELEVRSRVIYLLAPKQENNYLQGVGVGFNSLDQETTRVLEDFLRHSLLNDIYPVFPCFGLPGPQITVPHSASDSLYGAGCRKHLRS